MRFGNSLKYVALIMIAAGVVWAAAQPFNVINDEGWHVLAVTSTGTTVDTGVGFYSIDAQDSLASGLFLSGSSVPYGGAAILGSNDIALATPQIGTARRIYGKVTMSNSGATATSNLYVGMGDTARITVALSAVSTDSANATGTWSSTLTSGSGTARDSFLYGATSFLHKDSIVFGDTIAFKYPLAGAILRGETAFIAGAVDTKIVISFDSQTVLPASILDSARLIVFNPSGAVTVDTRLFQSAEMQNDSAFVQSGTVLFESGTTDVWVIYRSAPGARLGIRYAGVTVGGQATTVPAAGGTAAANTPMGLITHASLTTTPSTPSVTQVVFADLRSDTAARADAFARYDTNTSGFDTRLGFSVFELNLYNVNGKVTKLASGQNFRLVVGYNFDNIPTYSSIKLLRLNPTTEAWEVVSGSFADSINRRVVADVSEFSVFALGNVSTTTTTAAAKDDNCVINSIFGRTGFASVMPAIRGMRDSVMGAALGRFLISGYYGLGLAFLAFAGAGLAYARRK